MGLIMGSPVASGWAGVKAGWRRPVLCLERISKTILAMVMKFCGWLQLGKDGHILRQFAALVYHNIFYPINGINHQFS